MRVVFIALPLFGFWIVLSGKFDFFHLGAGIVSALAIAASTQRLLLLPPAIGPTVEHPFRGVRWLRFLLYLPWLAWEIVVSSVHVAYVVLHPRPPLAPRVLRFKSGLPNTLARLVLANSITITPGTVTLDVEGDEFVVHAFTDMTARSIENGRMQQRVGELFDPGAALPPRRDP